MSNGGAQAPPGWYPDPHAPGATRWWDGQAWTATQGPPQGPQPPSGYGMMYGGYAQPVAPARAGQSFAQANHQSLIAFGFGVGYLVLAATVHIVILGIIPAMSGIRAYQRKEPLGVLALVAGIGVAILGFTSLIVR